MPRPIRASVFWAVNPSDVFVGFLWHRFGVQKLALDSGTGKLFCSRFQQYGKFLGTGLKLVSGHEKRTRKHKKNNGHGKQKKRTDLSIMF